jgi:ketosteroid isomerase-like protein
VSTTRKDVVETYIEGFRRSDHAMVLGCLADDVVWIIYGQTTITGKDAFDAAIENHAFIGSPELILHRLVEEGDTVVATGSGRMTPHQGDPISLVFAEVFTFDGDVVGRLETFHINLD